ncbi:hypothetical protein MUK42_11782 [Musa troglodytarum]|uniref:Uncharacterized protein n=1 Tax=Musa troglodytarum TaxID=320322 RepID=A0A9E7KFU7_9LILI|nr:hypothetical protein MUK42_11782 [Musa troglodytarum]
MRGGALRRAAQGFGGIEISEDDEDEDLEFHADHAGSLLLGKSQWSH